MDDSKDRNILQLRAHHICCEPVIKTEFEERGSEYQQAADKIKRVLLSQPESPVMVIEGADELCRQCPLCIDGRCSSPRGNEDEVRKWDAILLKELGLAFNICLTAGEWQALIKQKTPFKLCHKCQWQQVCHIGAEVL